MSSTNSEKRTADKIGGVDVDNATKKKQRLTALAANKKHHQCVSNDNGSVIIYMAGGSQCGIAHGHYFVPAIQGSKIADIGWMSSEDDDDLTGKDAFVLYSNGNLCQWGKDQEFWYDVAHQERRISKTPFLTRVTQVAFGYHHAAAVKMDGSVWTWGYENASGQLGRKSAAGNGTFFPPSKVVGLNGFTIQQVACAAGATFALDVEGKVYSWGDHLRGATGQGKDTGFDPEPKLIENLPQAKQVSASLAHAGAVTKDGQVYTWGLGIVEPNKLRLGDDNGPFCTISNPTLLRGELEGKIVDQLICGANEMGAVTNDGSCYVWGHSPTRGLTLSEPVPLQFAMASSTCKIASISFGKAHAVGITTNRDVLVGGFNFNGQLGLGSKEESSGMVNLPPVFCGDVHKVVAMGDFTAILTKEERKPETPSRFSLQKLFNNPATFPDVKFTHGKDDDEVIICCAHKNILCQQSEYFRTMLLTDMKEMNQHKFPVRDFSKEVFLQVMKFLYGMELDEYEEMDPTTLPDLFQAAEFYQMEELKAWCCDAMKAGLSVENVGNMLQNVFARGTPFEPLEALCLDFLSENGESWAKDSKNTDSITDPKLWAKLYRVAFTSNEA